MPIVVAPKAATAAVELAGPAPEGEVKRELAEILSSSEQTPVAVFAPADRISSEYDAVLADADERRERSLKQYERMIGDTRDVALAQLARNATGCALFDELCLLVDVNQQYASLLPQWRDVAHKLNLDEVKAQWVQACVRPAEGLTRAMLEIYMRDGGTLGQVLQALLDLKCLGILEQIKPKVWAFLDDKSADLEQEDVAAKPFHSQFYSVLSTLANVFGKGDPCMALKNFSRGMNKLSDGTPGSPVVQQHYLVTSGSGDGNGNFDPNIRDGSSSDKWPKYDSSRHCKPRWVTEDILEKKGGTSVCRILLLFSADGVQAADETYRLLQGYEVNGVTAEVFRLNEASLWYEMLTQPEACCMKWANEADFVMPVLTPDFLREVHSGSGNADEDTDALVPTSPLINRFMYTLLRARFADSRCRNTMVRPVIPREHLGPVGQSMAVRRDPIFRLVWCPLDEDKVRARARGMLGEMRSR